MLVVRLSCDVLVDTCVRDARFVLRLTLEVGGGIAIASGVVFANTRLIRPPFVPEGVFTIAFSVGFFWPFFFAWVFGGGPSS